MATRRGSFRGSRGEGLSYSLVLFCILQSGVDVNKPNSSEQTALDLVRSFTSSKAARDLKVLLKGRFELCCWSEKISSIDMLSCISTDQTGYYTSKNW